jgi:hypothetical protein
MRDKIVIIEKGPYKNIKATSLKKIKGKERKKKIEKSG